eukprot:292613_1
MATNMNTHNDAIEFFDIMADEIVKTNFKKSVTSYKEAKITVPVKDHIKMRNLICRIKRLNTYWTDSSFSWYYIISSEIIKLFRNSAVIKFNNQKLTPSLDDFTAPDIGALLYQMLLYSQSHNKEKIEQK